MIMNLNHRYIITNKKTNKEIFYFGIFIIQHPIVANAFECSIDIPNGNKKLDKLVEMFLSFKSHCKEMDHIAKKIKDEISTFPEIQSKLNQNE